MKFGERLCLQTRFATAALHDKFACMCVEIDLKCHQVSVAGVIAEQWTNDSNMVGCQPRQ